ncbi:FMN-binding protein [Salinibacterium sp. SWN1162]|uniref:FMN-binding protein n=1 Tax=Salinibacterium sp. SWN1162 TaxID=2792053 RepID=UPI0018CD0A2A|nr:FMN-binding protein [Salinibacterium sp. SWN1162]MBH0009620.1 FMN-binding protein [Salinibacterium sp. SWN1162]
MRTRAILGSILASTSVLIVGYQAGVSVTTSDGTSVSLPVDAATNGTADGTNAGTGATTESSTGSTGSTDSGSSTSSTPGTDSAAAAPTASGPADGTYTGSSVSTRFGDVQVAVTIASGSITDVTALQLTDEDGRSAQISNRAAPILRTEVLSSQSAQVSNVSGATYTTDAYLSSLQSALDQAGA